MLFRFFLIPESCVWLSKWQMFCQISCIMRERMWQEHQDRVTVPSLSLPMFEPLVGFSWLLHFGSDLWVCTSSGVDKSDRWLLQFESRLLFICTVYISSCSSSCAHQGDTGKSWQCTDSSTDPQMISHPTSHNRPASFYSPFLGFSPGENSGQVTLLLVIMAVVNIYVLSMGRLLS